MKTLLSIRDLQIDFEAERQFVRAVDGVSLDLQPGQTLGLVGESGCGKTATGLSIARLLPSPPARYTGGTILLEGRDVLRMSKGELRQIRGGVVSYVFQEPGAALNPVRRIGWQIREGLRIHQPHAASQAEVVKLLRLVGIAAPETRYRQYPHELSGGMQQRVVIAMALASRPKLLVADEPSTALDVTIQAQIMDLLRSLKVQLGMSMLLITHNLALVSDTADQLAVMYAGQIVEFGLCQEVLKHPAHPYTRALLESVPALGSTTTRLRSISGSVPAPGSFPSGCRFHPRCPVARPQCSTEPPPLAAAGQHRQVRCPYHDQDAPRVAAATDPAPKP